MLNQYEKTIEDIEQGLDNLENTSIYRYEKQVIKTKVANNNLVCKSEKLKAVEIEGTKKVLLNNIEEFFIRKSKMKRDRLFYVVKVYIDEDNIVKVDTAYFGVNKSTFSVVLKNKESRDEIYIPNETTKEGMLKFIQDKEAKNIYSMNIIHKDENVYKIESLYGGEEDLGIYICKNREASSKQENNILKRFNKINYAPNINFFSK